MAFNDRAGATEPGAVLATANQAAGTVSLFEVAESGRMAEVHGSPAPSGGVNPQAVAFVGTGVLAVANAGSKRVTVNSEPLISIQTTYFTAKRTCA